jgi:hypothetical protein
VISQGANCPSKTTDPLNLKSVALAIELTPTNGFCDAGEALFPGPIAKSDFLKI